MNLADLTNLVAPPAWFDRAACRDADPRDFFPESGVNVRVAKQICLGCDVRLKCLSWQLDYEASALRQGRHGVFGGLSPDERAELARLGAIEAYTAQVVASREDYLTGGAA